MKISEGRKPPTYHKFRYWRSRTCKKGANNPHSKITQSVVDYIRENYEPHEVTAVSLGKKFGLSTGYLRALLRGQCWPGAFGNVGKRKLTAEQEAAIVQLFNTSRHLRQRHPERWSHRKLAQAFKVSKACIVYILSGKKKTIKEAIGAYD